MLSDDVTGLLITMILLLIKWFMEAKHDNFFSTIKTTQFEELLER